MSNNALLISSLVTEAFRKVTSEELKLGKQTFRISLKVEGAFP